MAPLSAFVLLLISVLVFDATAVAETHVEFSGEKRKNNFVVELLELQRSHHRAARLRSNVRTRGSFS